MIGGIETRTFEYNPDRQKHLAQSFFLTLWTHAQGIIGKPLATVELDTTVFTAICIDWHNETYLANYLLSRRIITRLISPDKVILS